MIFFLGCERLRPQGGRNSKIKCEIFIYSYVWGPFCPAKQSNFHENGKNPKKWKQTEKIERNVNKQFFLFSFFFFRASFCEREFSLSDFSLWCFSSFLCCVVQSFFGVVFLLFDSLPPIIGAPVITILFLCRSLWVVLLSSSSFRWCCFALSFFGSGSCWEVLLACHPLIVGGFLLWVVLFRGLAFGSS